jgi:hypothetical protein
MTTFAGRVFVAVSLMTLTLLSSLVSAEIRSDVDRKTISMGESLRLTITGDASERLDQLDLAALQFDWEILSSSSSTNTSFINGSRSTTRTLTLDLLPLRDGLLSIPALSTGGKRTTPIGVTVNPQTVSTGGGDSVRFSIDIDKQSVYVQEQIVLTVTIEQAINLDGAEVTQLELENAIVEELTRRNFQRQINGRLWRVTQLRYAIYPQQRGTLEIPALALTAREVLPGRSLLGARLGKRFRLSEDPVTINIKPVPESFPGSIWLPANSLELTQSWSKPPETMEVGDSTTRTLSLTADGLLSSQLPPITSVSESGSITGIRVYPDQESSDQIERTEGFLGKRTRSEALVASGSGSWTLPEVKVPWWNTETDSLEYAVLPSTTISVGSPALEIPDIALATAPKGGAAGELPSWIGFVAAAGWCLSLILSLLLWRATRIKASSEPVHNVEETLRPLMSALKASTGQNDGLKSRDLLVRWASLHAGRPVRTFEAMRSLCSSGLRDEIDHLEQSLYSPRSSSWSRGNALYRAVASESVWLAEDKATQSRALYPTA